MEQKILKKNIVAFCLFFYGAAFAAPPVDLTRPAPEPSPVGPGGRPLERAVGTPQKISEDDLLYSHPSDDDPLQTAKRVRILQNVVGRSLPKREGKPLIQLQAGDWVQVIRPSRDGRWQAVLVLKARRKVWIPSVAIPKI